MSVSLFLVVASGLVSTTYGYGEVNCGDENSPQICDGSAITASGVKFDPNIAMVALAMPKNRRLLKQFIHIKTATGPCVKVLLADKMNQRYIGKRGFDLTPAALKLLGETPHKYWSKEVFLCK